MGVAHALKTIAHRGGLPQKKAITHGGGLPQQKAIAHGGGLPQKSPSPTGWAPAKTTIAAILPWLAALSRLSSPRKRLLAPQAQAPRFWATALTRSASPLHLVKASKSAGAPYGRMVTLDLPNSNAWRYYAGDGDSLFFMHRHAKAV